MIIHTKIENGKAYLEFDFAKELSMYEKEAKTVLLQMEDREGQKVLEIVYPVNEEEPPVGLLLHPHFWKGISDPYLYRLRGYVQTVEGALELLETCSLALYSFEEIPGKGYFLNGKPFERKAVYWEWLQGRSGRKIETGNDAGIICYLEYLVLMGANTIFLPSATVSVENSLQDSVVLQDFLRLCYEKGFLVQEVTSPIDQEFPKLSQLFLPDFPFHTDTYYQYKAKWSKIPFLHINQSSFQKTEKGTYSLTVYSNQKKVALYVSGQLFEFLTGAGEYFFEEIPIKKFPAVLTAEAGECTTAITVYEGSHILLNKHK